MSRSRQTKHGKRARGPGWLSGFRTYLSVTAIAHLVWETLQLPLYTLWVEGSVVEQAFAIVHCTGGDVLIALATLTLGLVLAGSDEWPRERYHPVMLITLFAGIAYTIFSEWLNVGVKGSWAYSDLMPIVPFFGVGLSPLLQWFVVPLVALTVTRRSSLNSSRAEAAVRTT